MNFQRTHVIVRKEKLYEEEFARSLDDGRALVCVRRDDDEQNDAEAEDPQRRIVSSRRLFVTALTSTRQSRVFIAFLARSAENTSRSVQAQELVSVARRVACGGPA